MDISLRIRLVFVKSELDVSVSCFSWELADGTKDRRKTSNETTLMFLTILLLHKTSSFLYYNDEERSIFEET